MVWKNHDLTVERLNCRAANGRLRPCCCPSNSCHFFRTKFGQLLGDNSPKASGIASWPPYQTLSKSPENIGQIPGWQLRYSQSAYFSYSFHETVVAALGNSTRPSNPCQISCAKPRQRFWGLAFQVRNRCHSVLQTTTPAERPKHIPQPRYNCCSTTSSHKRMNQILQQWRLGWSQRAYGPNCALQIVFGKYMLLLPAVVQYIRVCFQVGRFSTWPQWNCNGMFTWVLRTDNDLYLCLAANPSLWSHSYLSWSPVPKLCGTNGNHSSNAEFSIAICRIGVNYQWPWYPLLRLNNSESKRTVSVSTTTIWMMIPPQWLPTSPLVLVRMHLEHQNDGSDASGSTSAVHQGPTVTMRIGTRMNWVSFLCAVIDAPKLSKT